MEIAVLPTVEIIIMPENLVVGMCRPSYYDRHARITQGALSLCVNIASWVVENFLIDVMFCIARCLLVSVGISYYRAVHRVQSCSHSSSD